MIKFISRCGLLGVVGLLTLTLGLPALAGSVPESQDPIKIAMNDWTGQNISAVIAGEVLKKMGYEIKYVVAGVQPQFIALKEGEIDVNTEVWDNFLGEVLPGALKDGSVVNLGDSGLTPQEGWAYPTFVRDLCPGLPDWEALKNCATVFATPDTAPRGRIVDVPADWGTRSPKMIKGLNLPYDPIPAGSEGALIAEIKASVAAKSPLLIWFWSPHWIETDVSLEFVKLPEHTPACEVDSNTWKCGVAKPHTIKIAWAGMKAKWPAAYRLIKEFKINNKIEIALMKSIDVDKQDLQKTVAAWVEANPSVWKPWIDRANATN